MPREKLVRPNFLIGLGMSAGTDRAAAPHSLENRALVDSTRMHCAVGLGVLVGARSPPQFSSTALPEESHSPQALTGSKSAAHGPSVGAFGLTCGRRAHTRVLLQQYGRPILVRTTR